MPGADEIWALGLRNPYRWSFSEWDDRSGSGSGSVYGFGEDEDGELHMSQGAAVYRFESVSSCDTEIFNDGFESGDTSAWTSTVP